MIRLQRHAAGGLAGGGALPDPGGTLDQSCWLMDAFAKIAGAEAELDGPEKR